MLFKTLFYLSLPVAILGSPTCYYPDGSVAENYVSCSDGNQISHCCSKESMCLTNGYCMATVGTYSLTRATCTDPSWPSDTCKNPCNYGKPPIESAQDEPGLTPIQHPLRTEAAAHFLSSATPKRAPTTAPTRSSPSRPPRSAATTTPCLSPSPTPKSSPTKPCSKTLPVSRISLIPP